MCYVILSFFLICVCQGGSQAVDEQVVIMGFQQWLAGVTERIHQTMHYQFDGKVDAGVVKNMFIK